MRYFKLFLILIVSISCDKEIPPVLPDYQPVMVVNCIIRPDTTINLFLSESTSVLTKDVPKSITGARISLYEENHLIGILNETELVPSNGLDDYRGGNLKPLKGVYQLAYYPKVGRSYRLEVTHPNYPAANAETIIPNQESSFDISLSEPEIVYFVEGDHNGLVRYIASIQIADSPKENYYELGIVREYPEQYGWDSTNYPIFRIEYRDLDYNSNHPIFKETNNPATLGDSGEGFSDDLFNNQEFEFQITFEMPVGGVVTTCCDPDDITIVAAERRFLIEMRSLSEEYYQYQYTSSLQESVRDDPFSEPVQVYSNIEGGIGIFGGYNIESFEFSIEEFLPEY